VKIVRATPGDPGWIASPHVRWEDGQVLPDIDERPADGITVERHGDGSLVTLWGEIDGSMRPEASASMVEAVANGGPIVVDTSGVTFIDSSGLGFVLQLYRLGQETGYPCTLRNPSPVVEQMLQMLGLAGHIEVEARSDA
jgi:anti-anti-sigma factor